MKKWEDESNGIVRSRANLAPAWNFEDVVLRRLCHYLCPRIIYDKYMRLEWQVHGILMSQASLCTIAIFEESDTFLLSASHTKR